MKKRCIKRIFWVFVFLFAFFTYTEETSIVSEATGNLLGDANSDNSVCASDIVRLKRILNGTAEETENSYIAGNETVGEVDLTILRQILVCDKDSTTVKTAFFIDNEGALAKMQTVPINGSAVPPMMPEKEGYYSGTWSQDYHQITTSTVLHPVYISDQADNIFRLNSAVVAEGEEVSLKVHLNGTVKMMSFQMHLEYDSDVLEIVSYGDDNENVLINHVPAKSRIPMNMTRTSNRTKALTLTQVTFRVKDGVQLDGTEVRLVVDSAYYLGDDGAYVKADYEEISGLIYME